jgi:hypothetical protein
METMSSAPATIIDTARLYEIYEEKRAFPRVTLNCPAIIVQGGERLRVTVYNLSPDGLQIRCDRTTAQRIHPSGRQIRKDAGPVLDVMVSLPQSGASRVLKTRCRAWYFAVVSDAEIAFGLRFLDTGTAGGAVIEQFLREALEPA